MAQKKTAWVLYYSNSGNTKKLADLAEETLKDCDTKSIIKGLDGVKTMNQKTCKRCYTCVRECSVRAVTVNWARNEKILRLAKKIVKSPGSRIMV